MAKNEITLPEVKVTGDLPPAAPITLPEVKIQANPAPPVGHVNVISPDGQLGHLPLDWLLQNPGSGFKLAAGDGIGPADLTADKQVKVVRKSDGVPGTVPLDWYLKDPQAKDFALASQVDPTHQQKVTQDLADLNKREEIASVFDASAGLNLSARHKTDDVQDKAGNWKLIGPDGAPLTVPSKYVAGLLASKAGFKFEDDNAQALFEAYQKQDKGTSGSIFSGMGGFTEMIPFHDKGKFTEKMLNDPKTDLVNKIERIDEDIRNTDSTAYKVGQGLSLAAQVLTPGGAFGEGKAAQAVGAAALAKLAPEGASLGRQILARGLATGLEGAIITSPQALAQAAYQDNPKAAAESLALGAGIGLFLGAGTRALTGAVEKGAELGKTLATTSVLERAGANAESLTALPGAAAREDFVKMLMDKGLSKSSKAEDVTRVMGELAQGEKLIPTLQKLDKVAETPLSSSELITKLTDSTADLVKNEAKLEPVVNSLGERLAKLADEKGNISLEQLQKFVTGVGSEINWKKLDQGAEMAKARIWQTGIQELMQAGDAAVTKADAKVAAAWAADKSITQIAQQMQSSLLKEPQATLNPLVKAITHGLSNKLTGAVAGAKIGGPVGAFIGGAINNAVIKPFMQGIETKLIEHYAENPANSSKLGNWLVRNKTADAIGSYLVLDAVKVQAHNIQAIPGYLRNIGEKTPAMFLGHTDPIKSILGAEANGLSKAQQFNRLSQKITTLSADSELRKQQFDTYFAPILKDHPQLANQVYEDYENRIQVMNQIVNANSKMKEPQAFAKNKPQQPTPAQLQEIENQLRIAMNPYALLDGLKNGKVTSQQVAIAAQLNPAILQDIRTELNKEAYSGKVDLTYQQRLAASKIMAQPMDPSLKIGADLQAAYAATAQAQAQAPAPKKHGGSSHSIKASSVAGYTPAQRITGNK